MEAAGTTPVRSLTLRGLDAAERQAIADLMGWKTLPEASVRLSIPRLEEALLASAAAAGLREVLEALGGPLVDRRGIESSAEAARDRLWADALSRPEVASRAELVEWLTELRALGLSSRAAKAAGIAEERLLDMAISAAARLPCAPVLLSVLASEVADDSHALDPGRPLGALVLRAAARLAGWPAVPETAADRRRLWAQVGVLCDPLSSTVLAFALRPTGDSRLARQLRESADGGEPRRLTLRELTKDAVAMPGQCVFVCENPAVVAAAADQLGPSSAPVVCLEGVPSSAVLALLEQLRRSGAALRFQADFDWAGVRIGNLLKDRFDAEPWRFRAPDYLAVAERTGPGVALRGQPIEASWDEELSAAMKRIGRVVFEEHIVSVLLEDLESGSITRPAP